MTVQILTVASEVEPFVDAVIESAEAHRNSFGFLADSVYRGSALAEKLHVAVDGVGADARYCGHIMFGGSNLQGRIFQIFVDPAVRGREVGRKLLESAISKFASRGFLSVSARVAADLNDANKFWTKVGFRVVKTLDGGQSKNRLINLRARDLEVPSLLDYMVGTSKSDSSSLGIGVDRLAKGPQYTFDLNVIFDVTKVRARSEQAGAVFRLACNNCIRLAITYEFLGELNRTAKDIDNDPMLNFAKSLPKLAAPVSEDWDQQLNELAIIVFPDQARDNKLSVQDRSDIKHLATSIYHGVSGFITSEKALLRASEALWGKYGVEVIAPHEFLAQQGAEASELSFVGDVVLQDGAGKLRFLALDAGLRAEVVTFLEAMRVPRAEVIRILGKALLPENMRGCVVLDGEDIIALGAWEAGQGARGVCQLDVFADDEANAVELALDHILDTAASELSSQSPTVLTIQDCEDQVRRRRVSFQHGFRAANSEISSDNAVQKISVGRPVTSSSWAGVIQKIEKNSGVRLPAEMPNGRRDENDVLLTTPANQSVRVDIKELETLMSPVLLLFSERRGAILPIRRVFADDLLGTSDQFTFLDGKEARLRHTKTYFCTPRAASVLLPGTPLLFYESGKGNGRSAAIAVGRVLSSEVQVRSALRDEVLRGGVLEEREFNRLMKGDEVLAVRFDNVMRLPKPIPFGRLKVLGCADDSNIVTARNISAGKIAEVVNESWSYEN